VILVKRIKMLLALPNAALFYHGCIQSDNSASTPPPRRHSSPGFKRKLVKVP